MNDPRKHHYIPVCYLKQWANTEDARLCEYKFIAGQGVKPRRTSATGTGYQADLYRVEGVPNEIAQNLEKRFMRLVDTDASRALNRIIAGDNSPWPARLRSGWTRFIMSLLFRNPEAVATIKNHIVEMWSEGVRELEADWAARRREDDPETFQEFFAKANPHAAHVGAANFLADIIDNKNIGPAIFNMQWFYIDLSKASMQLLTSDRPLDMPLGLGDQDAYIALPVSPRVLFIASNNPKIALAVERAKPTEVVRRNNKVVIEQARKFVWGTNDGQHTFVQRNFGKAPDRVLITDKQREEAINAAREKAPNGA